ncbi:hypothetical protein GDO81_004378 [Engystomops pustulosus]|uniref:Uncharacterized protein n=1 Tax=Engystomops pustulosus TaxID=76066 RepID=A0AAV6ZS59_ENGPU|nr:hypothetical protein GDO81_004378 [Engystomops pustulosus]
MLPNLLKLVLDCKYNMVILQSCLQHFGETGNCLNIIKLGKPQSYVAVVIEPMKWLEYICRKLYTDTQRNECVLEEDIRFLCSSLLPSVKYCSMDLAASCELCYLTFSEKMNFSCRVISSSWFSE